MLDGQPGLVHYDSIDEASSLGIGLGCNSIIAMQVKPITSADPLNTL